MKRLFACAMLIAATAFAADVAGTWKGTAEGPNGAIERTFVFKVDGSKLTGETTSEMLGKSAIENGKVEGDNVSFSITAKFQDREVKLNYTGKVAGDELQLTSQAAGGDGGGMTIQWKAKKVQ